MTTPKAWTWRRRSTRRRSSPRNTRGSPSRIHSGSSASAHRDQAGFQESEVDYRHRGYQHFPEHVLVRTWVQLVQREYDVEDGAGCSSPLPVRTRVYPSSALLRWPKPVISDFGWGEVKRGLTSNLHPPSTDISAIDPARFQRADKARSLQKDRAARPCHGRSIR